MTSKDFSLDREAWEVAVFRDAIQFTVVYLKHRVRGKAPEYDREEFPADQYPKAMLAAKQPTPSGRPRLLYAVTEEGRQIVLGSADQGRWLEIWRLDHGN